MRIFGDSVARFFFDKDKLLCMRSLSPKRLGARAE